MAPPIRRDRKTRNIALSFVIVSSAALVWHPREYMDKHREKPDDIEALVRYLLPSVPRSAEPNGDRPRSKLLKGESATVTTRRIETRTPRIYRNANVRSVSRPPHLSPLFKPTIRPKSPGTALAGEGKEQLRSHLASLSPSSAIAT